jgi:hypothetical protein
VSRRAYLHNLFHKYSSKTWLKIIAKILSYQTVGIKSNKMSNLQVTNICKQLFVIFVGPGGGAELLGDGDAGEVEERDGDDRHADREDEESLVADLEPI